MINFFRRIFATRFFSGSLYQFALLVSLACFASPRAYGQQTLDVIEKKQADFVFNTMYRYIYGITYTGATLIRVSTTGDWNLQVEATVNNAIAPYIPDGALQLKAYTTGTVLSDNDFVNFASVTDPSTPGFCHNLNGNPLLGGTGAAAGDWHTSCDGFCIYIDYRIVPGVSSKFESVDCAGTPGTVLASGLASGIYSITVNFILSSD